MKNFLVLLMTGCFMTAAGCAKPGSSLKTTAASPVTMPHTGGADASPALPAASDSTSTSTGSLLLEVSPSYAKGSIRGYLFGFEGKYILSEVENGSDGSWRYQITGVAPATYDLLVFGTSVASPALPQGQVLSARMGDIAIPTGAAIKLTAPELQKGADIKGTAALLSVSLPVGLGARIPGTHLHAEVAGDGSYEIPDIPLGRYSIELDCADYQSGMIAQVDLTQASIQEVAPITLIKPDFVGSGFAVMQTNGMVKGKDATLIMVPPAEAYFMKIGETPNLKDASWQPLVTTVVHSFASFGDKSLFVQFADKDQMNPSSIYANTFTLSATGG